MAVVDIAAMTVLVGAGALWVANAVRLTRRDSGPDGPASASLPHAARPRDWMELSRQGRRGRWPW